MSDTTSSGRAEKPIAPPPILYLGAVALGLALDKFLPILPTWRQTPVTQGVGIVLIVLNFAIFAAAFLRFSKAGTYLPHWKPTNALVTTGIYGYSRNPIYVALTLFYIGVAILVGSSWMVVVLAPLLLIMHYGVVKCEEAYLTEKFGQAYLVYCLRVRRWL